ncbi:MAG: hypothetical protein ABWZ02_05670 [Nakamurella sp.]
MLTGTISDGVESGCVILQDANGAVLANLFGVDTATVPVGSTVLVTGQFQQDIMTTCQQGKPFEVESVQVK